jgi:citrate lyase subunit beta / citryl-CoA lyase
MTEDFRHARSWLFVPGDSDRKLAKCWSYGADVIIVDLEDAVMPENKAVARALVSDAIQKARAAGQVARVVIRLNALQTGLAEDDIAATISSAPDGYVVPKVADAAEVAEVAGLVERAESRVGSLKEISIFPIATELPIAIFRLEAIARAHKRVKGIFWGMEDLGAELGALNTRGNDSRILPAFELVRSLSLFAASAAGVASVDTPFVDFSNSDGLIREANDARAIGYSGKLAIHPVQVPLINAAFSPSEEELEEARMILELSRNGGGAAFRYKGRMVDTPHLVAAERLLARAKMMPGILRRE